MSDADLLSVRDLRVEYLTADGDVCVVDNVSFRIRAGEILGLAGESGSGKTTIAKSILRVLQPPAAITNGSISFRDEDILSMNDDRLRRFRWRQISLVMQSAMNALNPVLSIGEQIADVIEAHDGIKRRQAGDRVASLLEIVGIDSARMNSYPHELSGGMRQRVVIAMALALRPPLVIMDEPTTALDVVVQKEILKQITRLKKELDFSILFITHDLSLMLEFCSHIGVLYAGRLVESAPADELHKNPQHPYTQGLMNSFPDARVNQTELHGISGSPPDMKNPPSGCRFHPRCPKVIDRCRQQQPMFIEMAPDHFGACHLLGS